MSVNIFLPYQYADLSSQALFDGGTAVNYLIKVKQFLDAHPNDVLTIIIANKADIPSNTFKAVFDKAGACIWYLIVDLLA